MGKRKGNKKGSKSKEEAGSMAMVNVQQSEEHDLSKKSLESDAKVSESEALLSDFLSSKQIEVANMLMQGRNLEDDPIIVVKWNSMNLLSFFGKIGALAMIPPIPPGLANALAAAQAGNIDAFIAAMGVFWTMGTGVVPFADIFFPSTVTESLTLATSMTGSAFNPWWAFVDAAAAPTSFPLVRAFVVKPHTNRGEVERFHYLFAGFGLYSD
jgi:hypothetical protein